LVAEEEGVFNPLYSSVFQFLNDLRRTGAPILHQVNKCQFVSEYKSSNWEEDVQEFRSRWQNSLGCRIQNFFEKRISAQFQ